MPADTQVLSQVPHSIGYLGQERCPSRVVSLLYPVAPVLLVRTGVGSHAITVGPTPPAAPDPGKRKGPGHAAAAAPTAAATQAQPPGTAGLPCVQPGAAAALHGLQVGP